MTCIRDTSFGGMLKSIRHDNGLTLREGSLALDVDAGNLSKMERNLLPPPDSSLKIHRLVRGYETTRSQRELLCHAAFQFHIGKLQERFS